MSFIDFLRGKRPPFDLVHTGRFAGTEETGGCLQRGEPGLMALGEVGEKVKAERQPWLPDTVTHPPPQHHMPDYHQVFPRNFSAPLQSACVFQPH